MCLTQLCDLTTVSQRKPTILGIETSCDETAVAVVDGQGTVAATLVASQHDLHGKYGGVVPELASRRHIETIEVLTRDAMSAAGKTWQDLDGIAVTMGPGLAGSLLVGASFSKGLAYALDLPLVKVNHLEGHIASAWLHDPTFPTSSIVLVVSGGHTHLFRIQGVGDYDRLGRTLDDAAGEAFDKAAKMLALEYPGGPAIDHVAKQGSPNAVIFPRAYLKRESFDFSFSGLKTSLLYTLRDLDEAGHTRPIADLAAGFQEAVVDVLVEKAFRAVTRCGVNALAVVGGVASNSRLREKLNVRAVAQGIRLALPPLQYCTDNAAMVALAGQQKFSGGSFAEWDAEPHPHFPLPRMSEPAPDEVCAAEPTSVSHPLTGGRTGYSHRPRKYHRTQS